MFFIDFCCYFEAILGLFWTLGANPGVPWRPKADHRILRIYLEIVYPHNSTLEPHFEVYHYLEWIRSVKIAQNPVVNSQNYSFFTYF